MDKIIKNNPRKEGWEEIEGAEEFPPHLAHFRFFYQLEL